MSREVEGNQSAFTGFRVYFQRAAKKAGPFFHAVKAETLFGYAFRVEAIAVVFYDATKLILSPFEQNTDVAGVGVSGHICQRFLDNAIDAGLDAEIGPFVFHVNGDKFYLHSVAFLELGAVMFQCRSQAHVIEDAGAQLKGQVVEGPYLFDQCLLQGGDFPAEFCGLGLVEHFQANHDRGQGLSGLVMEFTGHSFAFLFLSADDALEKLLADFFLILSIVLGLLELQEHVIEGSNQMADFVLEKLSLDTIIITLFQGLGGIKELLDGSCEDMGQ